MTSRHTVKARKHTGARSLDLTVPVDVCQEMKITAGDLFVVTAGRENGRIVLRYTRVHPPG